VTETRPTVLVTDGEQRAALAVVRSLGRAGYRVCVCSSRERSLAGASRYCRKAATVGDALTDPLTFLADVTALVRAWDADVVIPVSEAALLSILPARERVGAAQIPFADAETFRRVSDKDCVLRIAPRFGIGVPQQWTVAHREAIDEIRRDALAFPLVIKPSRSIGEGNGQRAKLTVRYANDHRQLDAQLAEVEKSAYPLLLQRRLRGPGVGVFLLLWDGKTIGVFSHRRIREKPPSGGVSVYCESIPADPSLVERSRALLEHFGWRGVAMVEYKFDEASGAPYLMEVNGRFWGSLQLAVDAGVDFPTLLLRAAAGRNPTPVLQYRTGVRSRWWWGDVDHLLARLRQRSDRFESPADGGGKLRALRDFLVVWRPGDRNEILRLDDPRPFLRETIDWLRGQ
jgi:predicted ATP-grasp superfamily ATP-dependent carboligase